MRSTRFTYFVVLISLVICLVSPLFSQQTEVRVDGQIIKNRIKRMADDKYLGRKPLTPEFAVLLDWAKNEFKKWGLDPAGDNGDFFQSVPISGRRGTYAFSTGTPEMVIDKREFFTKVGDFSIDYRSTCGKTFKSEIVFAGYGISAPGKGFDEYKGINVRNKFVFVFKGTPADVKAPRSFFAPTATEKDSVEKWEVESKDSTKILVAYKKGAAGIIFYSPETESGFRYRRTPIVKSSFERDFLIVTNVSEQVFNWIFWKDPQESSRGFSRRIQRLQLDIKNKKARSFATGAKIKIKGFETTTLYGEKFDNYKGRNVIAKITGSDPQLKDEYVVLGAHYDHLGVRNGQVYNGADDNASGSAVVMEVARLMKKHNMKPKRTVLFCLWTGEELGLIGSRYWVKNPTDGITMDKVVTNFNMDMVGLGEKIGAPGGLNFPSIWKVISNHQQQDILDAVKARTGGPGGSDHSGFIELGIEALALMTSGGGGHPNYHDTADDANKIEAEILRKTGQFVLQATINVANEPKSLIIPDRQHLYDGLRWNITAIDPQLKVRGGWSVLEAKTSSDLAGLLIKKVQQLKKPAKATPRRRYYRRRPTSKISVGITSPVVFKHDLDYLNVAYKTLVFGRIDVHGDDGVWFDKGLTDSGAKALSAMEDSSIVLNLIAPSKETFNDVLAAAKNPFLVSGVSDFDSTQIKLINEKKVLVTVDFDPTDVSGIFTNLKQLKEKFGDTDNLILNLCSEKNIDEVKKDLYMRLIKEGWDKKEIYSIGGSGTSRGSMGNFDRFVKIRSR